MNRNKIRFFSILSGILIMTGLGHAQGSEGGCEIEKHMLEIELFPERRAFTARDVLTINASGEEAILALNGSFEVSGVHVDGEPAEFRSAKMGAVNEPLSSSPLAVRLGSPGRHEVDIEYSGLIHDQPSTAQFSREYLANQTTGLIGPEGSYLSPAAFWYPRGEETMTRFEIKTTTPAGYETVTQGTRLSHETKGGKLRVHWKNEHPSDGLTLQAGPYSILEDKVDDVAVYTYFYPGGEVLAAKYLSKSRDYLSLYSEMLGEYPYGKFAVVENFFETGYGMPSWTLLGRTVVRLPFIPDTSLPHEICHNWWGNGVFVDYASGNWCEGLTVFCADYWLKKRQGRGGGMDYRRQINRDYASYVKANSDFPLTDFRSRHNPATRAVGYGKTMMVYHDLERRMGEERFFSALRRLMEDFRFKYADWHDVLTVFESESGLDLAGFYTQWVERAGAPVLKLEGVELQADGDDYRLSFRIAQDSVPYELDVPVLIRTLGFDLIHTVDIKESLKRVSLSLSARPMRLEIDPDHHLFRRLYPEEIPPSVGMVFGSENQLIVIGSAETQERRETFMKMAEMINRTKTGIVKTDTETAMSDFDGLSVILLGETADSTAASVFRSSLKEAFPWELSRTAASDVSSVVVYRHPGASDQAVMIVGGRQEADLLSVARKLPHYGKYSYLLFSGETQVGSGIWDIVSSPLIHVFSEEESREAP